MDEVVGLAFIEIVICMLMMADPLFFGRQLHIIAKVMAQVGIIADRQVDRQTLKLELCRAFKPCPWENLPFAVCSAIDGNES